MATELTRAECLMVAGERLHARYGDSIPRAELQSEAAKLGGYKLTSIIPSDHCYDLINEDPSSFVSPLFELSGRGVYRFLGPRYPYTGTVKWKPKSGKERTVGKWGNGNCVLDHDPRKGRKRDSAQK